MLLCFRNRAPTGEASLVREAPGPPVCLLAGAVLNWVIGMLTKQAGLTVLVFASLLPSPVSWRSLDGRKPEARSAQSPRAAKALPSLEEFWGAVADLRASVPEEPASREAMERALKILDSVAIAGLTGNGQDVLPMANQRLAGYVTRQPAAGEGYKLYQIGHGPDVYALAANFGSSGPSAVLVYARLGPQEPLRVAGRIDRFSQKDYFDDYLELVGIDSRDVVFLTVTGRTDELQSGWFAAWRFDGKVVVEMWSSELLSHSSYETIPGGIAITYCADSDEQNPVVCRKMMRERHLWDGTSWKRAHQEEVPASGH